MATVTLENVTKRYGVGAPAVHDLSTELPDGELTVLVGPSGCGKTTTLRMLAGLEPVTSGRILIGDRDVTGLEPRDRDVAMVFQNYALYPHLSVRENIAFPLRAKRVGIDRAEIDRRVERAARGLGLDALLDRKPRELSGGQQQRVAIGRAIVRQPQVFLFDEPLSNLDAKLRVEMRTELLALQRELATTAVYVTHDQEEAMTLSDLMIVLRDGRVAQRGTPAEIYARPADTFVAAFIGSPKMNLFPGTLEAGILRAGPFALSVTRLPGGEITLGVRPEDVLVGPAAVSGGAADESRQARVELVELLGPRAIVTLSVERTRLTAVVEASALDGVREGGVVPVAARRDHIHLFSGDGSRVDVSPGRTSPVS